MAGPGLRWIFLTACLAVCTPALAQQSVTGANLGGRVIDATGAAVPGASVQALNTERNQTWNARSDGQGRFQFLALPVGPYQLDVQAAGFAERRVAITLSVGGAFEVPLTLDVAGVTAAVEVTAPIIETRRSQVAGAVTPAEISALPLNGRNYLDLALLVPTVTRTTQTNTQRFAETSAVPGTGISISGQRNLHNNFIVDGLSANDDAADLAGTYFAESVIREFQVVTAGGMAEFGRASGGVINIVTQSGTNRSHGEAYGFFRHDRLDARNVFATSKDPLTRSQYGFSLGGALVPNRTFWFANVEQTRLNQTSFVTIPQANVDAVNRALALAGYGGPRLATGAFVTGYDTTNLFGRVDHAWSASRLAVRYSLYDVSSENARNVGGLNAVSRGTPLDDTDHAVGVNLSSPLSAEMMHELRGQIARSSLAAPPNDPTGPAINVSGIASLGTATSSPTRRDLDLYQVTDSLLLQKGPHLFKVGGDFQYQRVNIEFPGALQGVYAFSSLANLERGIYTNFQQSFGQLAQFQTNPNLGLFAQDEWQPRGDLTINAGLRYDVQWLERLVNADGNNVSPRLGVAFAPGDRRTVIRGSVGLYFDRIPMRALSNALQRSSPANYAVAVLAFGQAGAPVFPQVMPAFPAGVLPSITTIDPDIPSGVSRQAGVQVEREIGHGVLVSASYQRLDGRHIIMSINTNVPTLSAAQAAALGVPNLGRPDPTVANNTQYQGVGRSQYDGLSVSVKSNHRRWGTVRASYTVSRAQDDAGNNFFNQPQDASNVHADWGRSDNDQRHRVVVSGTTAAGRALAGLQFGYVYSYNSAPPFNVQTGGDRNNDTNINDRPAGVARNTGVGFDYASLDLRVSRAFTAARGHRIEIMVEGFNVLNRANFLNPNTTFGTGTTPLATFGRPTVANDPRQMQLGARWSF